MQGNCLAGSGHSVILPFLLYLSSIKNRKKTACTALISQKYLSKSTSEPSALWSGLNNNSAKPHT